MGDKRPIRSDLVHPKLRGGAVQRTRWRHLRMVVTLGVVVLAGCVALPGPQLSLSTQRLDPPRRSTGAFPTLPLFPTPTQDGAIVAVLPVKASPQATLTESVCVQAQEYVSIAGDTVESVAQRFNVPAGQLSAANRLDLAAPLAMGRRLIIPCVPFVAPSAVPVTTADAPATTPVPGTMPPPEIIGYSVSGYPLEAYRFGTGPDRVVLIGGIHGGYEWNTVLLAYAVIDYLNAHPESIPPNVTVEIIPAANPDGLVKVVGHSGRFNVDEVAGDTHPGRLNGNQVDLNRNWDCRWAPIGLWGRTEVGGGIGPHSEPETQVLIGFLRVPETKAVIFWHSAVPGVFAGGCEEDFAPGIALAHIYAAASGYPFQPAFTSYVVTGDSVDWLATQGLPAIEVELRTHETLDWEQNIAGVLAVLLYYRAGEP